MIDRIAEALGVLARYFASNGRETGRVDPDIQAFYEYDFNSLPSQLKTWHKSTLDLLRKAANAQKTIN